MEDHKPSPADNWFGWLAARIPGLHDSGAYKFWIKQALKSYSDEQNKQVKQDKIQMIMQLQEQFEKTETEYQRGKREGYAEGWKAYGESL